jgi:dynein heavy chain 2
MLTFFDLELGNALSLVQKLNHDLSELTKILRGTVLLSNHVQEIGQSLLKGETPKSWLDIYEGSERAITYMETIIKKTIAIQECQTQLMNGTFYKTPLNMDSFLNPITFLNAHRQLTSRKLKRPMDTLKLVSSWDSQGFVDYITIQGLLIQGAKFDVMQLQEQTPDDPIFSQVPNFRMAWIPMEDVVEKDKVSVPVYSDPGREKRVTNLPVPCVGSKSVWVLAGVSFFFSIE